MQVNDFLHMFVVRDLPGDEVLHHKQTETKPKGRRTGESPAVLLVLRIGESRSDLPPLFN
jgi:hypothetical protein